MRYQLLAGILFALGAACVQGPGANAAESAKAQAGDRLYPRSQLGASGNPHRWVSMGRSSTSWPHAPGQTRDAVIKNGDGRQDAWGSQSQRGNWASSSKPVLSTLLLFAIDQGKLAGVDARVGDQGWKLADKDRTMTFAHLANMTSGYARPEPPGAAWAYNDYAIQLYQKTLFDHVFQGDPDQVAATCFAPLGLEDGLQFDPKRRRLLTSVRDFARVAWFWLNKGNWNGRQVLPRKFFDDYQRPHVPAGLPVSREAETNDYLNIGTYGGGSSHFNDGGPGLYGFNWWFNRPVASTRGEG